MWPLTFLLLPIVLVASDEFKISNYIVEVQDDTLMNVRGNDRSLSELNLSGYGIRRIDKFAFNDTINVKILNISNNFLFDLPESVFLKLTNLTHLSLANNKLKYFRNAFVGLDNLKSLDISNNPLGFIGSQAFSGLGHSVNILTSGSPFHKISTSVFQKDIKPVHKPAVATRIKRELRTVHNGFTVIVCIEDGKLTLVDFSKANETRMPNCFEMNQKSNTSLTLNDLNIASFEKGWYRLKEKSIDYIGLKKNKIAEITKELLNDLPENIKYVDLDHNVIERVKRNVIENFDVAGLSLINNAIHDIESDAFQRSNLDFLFLDENRLSDMTFIATLPKNIRAITLRKNHVIEIPDNCFSNLRELQHLFFDGNYITEIRKNSLLGTSKMLYIGFEDNQINRIEPGSFREFEHLVSLYLSNNNLSYLENGTLDVIGGIENIYLDMNKFTDAAKIRDGLPQNLKTLSLMSNNIGNIEYNSFVNVPRLELDLRGNKISKIAKGSFNLPKLNKLDLGNNFFSQIDGDAFKTLPSLHKLSLDGNAITEIEKGFAKYMKDLSELDISRNPIKRLQNGALFGMTKNAGGLISTSQTPIELIQGGLFDNV